MRAFRSSTFVLPFLLCLPGCARAARENDAGGGRDTPASDTPPLDAPRADTPSLDTGRVDASVADVRVATDTGGTDTRVVDASASDGGAPDVPTPGTPGSSCVWPIDVSGGGTFSVDTCMFTDTVASGCGAPAAADVVLGGDAPGTGSTYTVTVPSGWAIDQVSSLDCTASSFSCSRTGTYSVSGATFPPRWFFVLSRLDGDCGPVDVLITRTTP
jgi:hypothetical protein